MVAKSTRARTPRQTERRILPEWRRLDKGDIAGVLVAMGIQTEKGSQDKHRKLLELQRSINRHVKIANERRSVRDNSAPHATIALLQKIQNAATELQAALHACPGVARVFAYAVDRNEGNPCYKRAADPQELQAEFPELGGENWGETLLRLFLSRSGVMLPSAEAKATVERALQSVAQVEHLSKLAIARERDRQIFLGTDKRQVKRADDVRYLLIAGLASTYEAIFGVAPTATRTGPWCSFLAAVLTCCEDREMNIDSAYRIWRKTIQWLKLGFSTLESPFHYDEQLSRAAHVSESVVEDGVAAQCDDVPRAPLPPPQGSSSR